MTTGLHSRPQHHYVAQAALRQLVRWVKPGGKADYLAASEPSLDAAIENGFLLADDREEILAIAAINFDKALAAARSGDSSSE